MRSSVLMDSSKSQRGKAEQPGASMRASWGLVLLVPKNNPLLGACGWQRSQHREHQPGAGGCLCLGGCLHQGGCLLLRPTTSSTRMEQGPLSHWIPVRYSQHQSTQGKKKNRKKALVQDDPGTTRYQCTWVWCCSSRLQSNPSPTSTSLPSHPNPFQHVEDFRWGKGWDEGAPELAADAGMTHLTASSLVMQPSTYAASPSPLSSVAATHRMKPMSNLQEQ